MDKKQMALGCFDKSFNCAQSVFAAFAEEVGIDKDEALKVASCFGGGMKSGEVCGAVTGALMAIGMKYGSSAENDVEGKRFVSDKTVEFIKKFSDKNGTILCRELLGLKANGIDEMQEAIRNGHDKTVCSRVIADAVDIAEEMFAE